MRKRLSYLLSVALICISLAGCGQAAQTKQNETGDSAQESEMTSDITSGAEANSELLESEKAEGYMEEASKTYDIDTDYCTLKYPEKWKGQVDTKIDKEDVYTVKFSSMVDSKEYALFDVCFGGRTGTVVGKINVKGQEVPVSIVTYELNFSDDISQETKLNVLAMQEDVNVIIQNLEQYKGFVPGSD